MSMVYNESLMMTTKALATESQDASTKVAAILATRGSVALAYGVNSFADGVSRELPERHERPVKYAWTVHAEMNALATCAKAGHTTRGLVCYSTQIPCSACMGVLIQAGIVAVFCPTPDLLASKWKDDAEITMTMAQEAGVLVKFFEA